jgi:hypothetical protein
MRTLIITDVTRFAKSGKLCVAGIDVENGECIRPMIAGSSHPDYLTHEACKTHDILPGTVLTGTFADIKGTSRPHHEDRLASKMKSLGASSAADFEEILRQHSYGSLSTGFGADPNGKVFGLDLPPPVRSIITLRPRPGSVHISDNPFNPGRIQAAFVDEEGHSYSNLPITDLGLYDFVGNPQTRRMSVDSLNDLLRNVKRTYLRVGLSRAYAAPDGRNGYWLQLNGVYTFPAYSETVRRY